VGESGSGKTVTALSLLNLIPPPGQISAESIIEFDGVNLLGASRAQLREIRGGQIGTVFQNPGAALNPVLTAGDQVTETVLAHRNTTQQEAKERAREALQRVGLTDTSTFSAYPHMLSGGMQQRVMIAMAIVTEPTLLIADEPTTSLDVTVQAQIVCLLRELVDETNMALIMISHDLGVINQVVDRTIVMYLGEAIEDAPTTELLRSPSHPYTSGLIASVLKVGGSSPANGIPGRQPIAQQRPCGCSFHPRCDVKTTKCETARPEAIAVGPRHYSACWLNHPLDGGDKS
jgi:oligopeptide/dipeptide ABC transporter ATP-binding protein